MSRWKKRKMTYEHKCDRHNYGQFHDQFTSVPAMGGNLRMASAATEVAKPLPTAGSTETEVPDALEERPHA
jgi:hypothetical protein